MGNQCSDAQPTEDPAEQVRPTQLPSSTQPSDAGVFRVENPQPRATALDRESHTGVDGSTPPPHFSGSCDVSSAAARTQSGQGKTLGAGSISHGLAQPVSHMTATVASKKTSEAPVSYKALFKETMERVRAAQETRRAAERAPPLGPVQLLGSVSEVDSNSKASNRAVHLTDDQSRQRELSSERRSSGSNALTTGTAGTRKSSVDQHNSSRSVTNPLAPSETLTIHFSDSASPPSKESSGPESSVTDPLGSTSSCIVRRQQSPRATRKAVGVRKRAHSSRSSSGGYAGERSASNGSGHPAAAERPLSGDAFGSDSSSSASSPTTSPTRSRVSSVSRSSVRSGQ